MTRNLTLRTTSAFLAGAGAGAALALLYAPNKGTRTRRDLRRFAIRKAVQLDEFKDKVGDFVGETGSKFAESFAACTKESKRRFDVACDSVPGAVDGFKRRVGLGTFPPQRHASSRS